MPESINKPKIVLIDDSSAIRAFFMSALSEFNFEIFAFGDPEKAIPEVAKIQPDCILSDYEMPNLNGIEFCKAIKLNPACKDIPFVILSMHDNDKYILDCLSSGVDDYLPKRTNPEIIVAKVRLMIEVSQARKNQLITERMKTYSATIATLKHEWNNLFAVLFPILEKLTSRKNLSPEGLKFLNEAGGDDKTLDILHRSLEKVQTTIVSFREVKEIDFEQYTNKSSAHLIKKTGS